LKIRIRASRVVAVILGAAALLALCAGPASAGGIVNGGFESGTREGWQVKYQNPFGRWFVTSHIESPWSEQPVLPPYEGTFDAITDASNPSSMILYQDVFLDPLATNQLSLEFNYHSDAPIAIPTPDSLEVAETGGPPGPGEANQQVRVDVMKAGSAITSLDPSDILITLFENEEGDPEEIGWTHLGANLAPFVGQTVRIRVAVADNEAPLIAGLDAVYLPGAPVIAPPPAPAPEAHCVVPKLKGKKLKAAKRAIRAGDCKVGHVGKKEGVTAKTGKVIRQNPKAGTTKTAGSKVNVKLG
jgi:hypothetical protein